MIGRPDIKTALPKRRYRYGEFTVVVLGDIETGDPNPYRYLMAVVREGEAEPGMYLTCEPNPDGSGVEGDFAMRMILPDGARYVAGADQWRDLEVFCDSGLQVLAQVLKLSDETPYRMS